jgi:hypothetical protein
MQQQVEDLRNEISANFIESHHFVKQVHANIKQIALVPAARQQCETKVESMDNENCEL